MELNFRIWDDKNQKMIYLIDSNCSFSIKNDAVQGISWYLMTDDIIIPPNKKWENVMQHTGLFDKNNQPVYVGDIIKYQIHYFDEDIEDIVESYKSKDMFDEIVFVDGEFKASKSDFGYEGEDMIHIPSGEVIGNIKENNLSLYKL
jgi:uncharacterized phage protein (TIGR01671 family)